MSVFKDHRSVIFSWGR